MFGIRVELEHPVSQLLQQVNQDVLVDEVERKGVPEESFLDFCVDV